METGISSDFEKSDLEYNIAEVEEEQLILDALPHKALCHIVEKLSYAQYAIFEEASTFTRDVCNSQKFSLIQGVSFACLNKNTVSISMNDIWCPTPARLVKWHTATAGAARLDVYNVYVKHRISGKRLRVVGELLRKNKSILCSISFTEQIIFTPADLECFLKDLPFESFRCSTFLSKDFFKVPSLQNIENLHLKWNGCLDEDFLQLKNKGIYMRNEFITDRGLNRFLKQWKRKEREISFVEIEFDSSFNTRRFDNILDGLDANIIWTPDTHKDSLVGCIPAEELYFAQTGDTDHWYSLLRSDNIAESLGVRLTMGHFACFPIVDEAKYFLESQTEDHYYEITKRCMGCQEEFCEHRRRLSVCRTRKLLPTFYGAVITAVRMAGYWYALETCKDLIGGSNFPVQPMSKNNIDKLLHELEPSTVFTRFLVQMRIAVFNR